MLIHLPGQRLRHGANSLWLLHAAEHGVFGGVDEEFFVRVHAAVVVHGVAEFGVEGVEEAGGEEGGRGGVDAGFALRGGMLGGRGEVVFEGEGRMRT